MNEFLICAKENCSTWEHYAETEEDKKSYKKLGEPSPKGKAL
jgi:hypothetical protein